MDEKMQETPEKQASTGLVEHLEPEVLRRNVSKVLEELDKNRFQNSPPARLVAVTKTVGPDVINQLKALNILDIGENRAQVALPKLPKIAPEFLPARFSYFRFSTFYSGWHGGAGLSRRGP